MNYYSDYNNPVTAQQDDLDIVGRALALARTLRDDVAMSKPSADLVAGVASTIKDSSYDMNHVIAGKEIWRFGAYLPTTEPDELDAMISDYLETAEKLVEDAEL